MHNVYKSVMFLCKFPDLLKIVIFKPSGLFRNFRLLLIINPPPEFYPAAQKFQILFIFYANPMAIPIILTIKAHIHAMTH